LFILPDVTPTAPQLSTQIIDETDPTITIDPNGLTSVPVGTSVHDTTSITGDGTDPVTGTVTYTFYSTSGYKVYGPYTVPVNDGGAFTGPPSDSTGPLDAGSYYYIATYEPIAGNHYIEAFSPPEKFTVNQAQPTITTQESGDGGVVGTVIPQDTATVTGGYLLGGTVTFTLTAPDHTTADSET